MKTKVVIAALLMAITSVGLNAQVVEKRGGLEINGGLSLSSILPGESIANTGAGAELLLHYRVTQHFGIYGGWGYNVFRNIYPPAGHRCNFEETGYTIGIQYKRQIEFSNSSLFVRAGYQYKHIEIEEPSGELLFDTTHGPGWQAGCGIDIPLTRRWSMVSEVRFNYLRERAGHSPAFPVPDKDYFSLRLGLLKKI